MKVASRKEVMTKKETTFVLTKEEILNAVLKTRDPGAKYEVTAGGEYSKDDVDFDMGDCLYIKETVVTYDEE